MCHLITVVIALRAEADVRALAVAHGLRLVAFRPPTAGLRDGEHQYATCPGQCDCGTPLGATRRSRGGRDDDEHQRAKLSKKGWGAAKIDRWLAQVDASRKKKQANHDSRTKSCEAWCDFIVAALDARIGTFGLMLHWSDGSPLEVVRRVSVDRAALSPAVLAEIEENVLYDLLS